MNKKIISMAAVFCLLSVFSAVSYAATIYTDQYIAEDTVFLGVAIDGDYLVASNLSKQGSFSGWGNLSGFTDLSATLTFTWHDDNNLNYGNWNTTAIYTDTNNWDTIHDTTIFPPYPDLANVTLDGTTVIETVEVGVDNTTDPSTYEYVLSDLSMLDDGELVYLVQAERYSSARTDFVLDSITLTINGTPSSVPVPGAGWLLGAGLLSLSGIRRKKA